MKMVALCLAWCVSLAVAGMVAVMVFGESSTAISGGAMDVDAEALRRDNAHLEQRVAELQSALDMRDADGGSDGAPPRAIAAPTDTTGSVGDPGEPDDEPVPMDGVWPSLEGITTPAQASALLMRFVDQQLARGPEGYETLFKALGSAEDMGKTLGRIFSDESAALRVAYPWVKFLVAREGRILDASEHVFKTMAENPTFFEGMDDDPFEIFTEGVAGLLPGAVDEKRLDRFRAYAKTILATPEGSMPPAIEKNRSEIKRALERYWSKPITTEQALAKLKTGGLSSTDALKLLKGLTPEQLQGVDVNGILAQALAGGRYEAIQALRNLPPMPLDHARLDAGVHLGLMEGDFRGWYVTHYLGATGRDEWVKARPFFDAGLASNAKARNALGDALMRLRGKMKPDAAYIADVLSRYELPEHVKRSLKAQYNLK